MRKEPPNTKQTREFKVPYLGALRAFAFACSSFKLALQHLESLGFYVPTPGYGEKPPYSYDLMKAKFEIYQYEAWNANRTYTFSDAEADNYGVSPLYQYVRAEKNEDDVASYDIQLLSMLMDDMRCIPLRRAICTLLWQGNTPEKIPKILDGDRRAPAIQWYTEQVKLFMKFYWMVGNMSHNDWLKYGNMCNILGTDRHFEYMHPIIEALPGTTWHGEPSEDIDTLKVLETVIAHQDHEFRTTGDREHKLKLGRAAAQTCATYEKIIINRGILDRENIGNNPLEDVELVITKERAKQLAIASDFIPISEIDGDISDPRDVESSRDDYLGTD